ncbi:RNA-binding cell elongation regulator Jag/EloR [Johnsonella ignava]|uniref:RNA-binding cell elongation regulator Jag/EloR n=1 Tax=Johnsonella ignava TaxID=43995 RepID=UPI0023F534D9|nr:RNA-binding cell elongation regulator Jag/EloR [Johnsonella ignava]
MDKIRVSAKNYDEAVTKALLELQTSSENVKVDIIEEGTNGFLGIIGGKPWVIEASLKDSDDKEKTLSDLLKDKTRKNKSELLKKEISILEDNISLSEKKQASLENNKKHEESYNKASSTIENDNNVINFERKKEELNHKSEKQNNDNSDISKSSDGKFDDVYDEFESKKWVKKVYSKEEADKIILKGEDFLKKLLASMDITAETVFEFDFNDNEIFILIKSDDDLGILIGKRGKTLDSFQYLLSLVVNRDTESYIRVKLDTQNYRQRRKERLEGLARNIAAKVKKTKKPFSLEPMNPYERRIIHSALQNYHTISTLSEGEDPNRYITIAYKGNSKRGHHSKGNSKKDFSRNNAGGYLHKNDKINKNDRSDKDNEGSDFRSETDE